MQKGFVLLFLCLSLIVGPLVIRSMTTVVLSEGNVPEVVRSVANQSALESKGMLTGVAVYNLTKGKRHYTYQAEKSFVPASTLKLITAAASLAKLTPEYSFKTELFVDGKVSGDGTLKGNLVLKGYGDPSFGSGELAEITRQLTEQTGIQRVDGDLVLDESYFDDVRLGKGWMWDDEIWSFSSPISALALERNQVELQVAPTGVIGGKPFVHYPVTSGLKIDNQAVITSGSYTDLEFYRAPGENTVLLTGSIGKQAKPEIEELAVVDPALFLGEQWKAQLVEAGVSFSATSQIRRGLAPKKKQALFTHFSAPLQEVVTHLNKESDNLYAEMLLKTLGAVEKGEGSFEAGLQVVSEYLRQVGIADGYTLVDGSGLSRLNRITPEQLLQLLIYVEQQPYGKIFEQTMPIAGVDGTLEKRWAQSPFDLKAKTGSMSGVYNLAGYLRAENGDKLAFVLFLNGINDAQEAVLLQDKVVKTLVRGDSLAPFDHYPNGSGDEVGRADDTPFSAHLDTLLQHPDLRALSPGIMIQSVDTGKRWYARNEHKLLTPGSAVKALTTFAALKHLGPEYTFRTSLYLLEPPIDGVAGGDLLIKGDGDPTLDEQGIRRLVQQLPIRRLRGDVLVDDSYFDPQRYPLGWTWDGENRVSQPPIGALSINRNTLDLEFQPGSWPGAPIHISPFPGTAKIRNHAQTSLFENNLRVQRLRGDNQVIVSGEMFLLSEPRGERIPIADPDLYTGEVVKRVMAEKGMGTEPTVKRGKVDEHPTAVLAAEIRSEPLKRLIEQMNQTDDHFYAEMILKTLGLTQGDSGHSDTEKGLKVLTRTLQANGIEPEQLVLSDGSGLSRYNLLAAEPLTRLLAQEPSLVSMFPSFYIEGIRGIYSLMEGGDVGSFAGYVQTRKGERVAVTILLNGWTKEKRTLERTIKAILEKVRES
ncbi:D-alanyl-D-alanine carboxypeptidase/D-alanyl-D-alanine endopeptidase [Ammoniphilus resinae]|uniref:PBP4 family serine-type D-alanyl-D-alanine carboxypeptidase n=1 Tax=Ammoniphilus resinae TaxID=861532 RepID=A0ABS4GX01_9BACL|nr:D-alanyl-D-alanine carboxypeptidase/D-alanyl-D-alanine-endopeptidase [Ammoniphilus resinae]MBP1934794.1 PBP4 family serine-type D-alanyl-D-alanine carboxypeptidase [Ammoniphilus resinae]